MLGIISFPLFVGATFLLNITPGPDTAFVVGRSVAQGRLAGALSALGIGAGSVIHSLACAFGLSAILAASPSAFLLIKMLGALYLMYLGINLLRASWRQRHHHAEGTAPVAALPMSPKRLFMQGFITNLLNPKVILFFLSFFPQFVAADSQHTSLAFLLLGAVFVVMGTAWNLLVAMVAGSLSQRMSGNQRLKCWLDRVVGTAFIGLGVKLAS
ncbi:lysine transporter LysE [Pokkaliibacter plantistimulans]|uniref:Lysine transporter LysE n=1 Tax=Pokkaliibacter plantistimulans TaxID=1635171 RepID=A0ABX5LSX5_9GAMM|nr:LysE family translocator [Pokkaliibacter plantistimulans]PXF29770.1 lysine transporter LysE [Pokkaliibacter plantistimulans]